MGVLFLFTFNFKSALLNTTTNVFLFARGIIFFFSITVQFLRGIHSIPLIQEQFAFDPTSKSTFNTQTFTQMSLLFPRR